MDIDHIGGGGDEAEAAFFARQGRRCCCFPCWPSSSSTATTTSASLSHQRLGGAEEESWWQGGVDALLKVREWSELAAGPRWKTFIRRFGRNGGGGPRPHSNFGRKLNYDALSYALNFDEGGPGATPEGGDHAGGFRDFSSRFAAPPASARSSMDLGGRDAPPLFGAPSPADGPGRA